MTIKKKSLIVVFISSVVICGALVLTLLGYVIYIELKDEESKSYYQNLLQKLNTKIYAKHLEVSKLNAKIEEGGPLKGKAVVEGLIKNCGNKSIKDSLVKMKFLDNDGAVIYEIVFHPQEPSLGTGSLTQLAIPYLYTPSRVIIKPNDSLHFKKILSNCPDEIRMDLQKKVGGFVKGAAKWSGNLDFEILFLDFLDD